MQTVQILVLHDPNTVAEALRNAAKAVQDADIPTHLHRDAFSLAFGALTAREVAVIEGGGMPAGIDGLLRP